MADESKEKVGVAKSFFWIAAIAFGLMVIIAVGLWGCQRWKHNEGHDQPQSRLVSHEANQTPHSSQNRA